MSPFLVLPNLSYSCRVRQDIRDGHEDFVVTGDSWPAFLFPHAKAPDPKELEKGFFKSAILLKVEVSF